MTEKNSTRTALQLLTAAFNGQSRWPAIRICHLAGIYDPAGTLLARGDLEAKDFRRIARGLGDHDLIVILNHLDSVFHSPGNIGSSPLASTSPEFLADRCIFVVAAKKVFLIREDATKYPPKARIRGLAALSISRADARAMIMTAARSSSTA